MPLDSTSSTLSELQTNCPSYSVLALTILISAFHMDPQARYHIQEWLSRTIEEPEDTHPLDGAFPELGPAQIRAPQGGILNTAGTAGSEWLI